MNLHHIKISSVHIAFARKSLASGVGVEPAGLVTLYGSAGYSRSALFPLLASTVLLYNANAEDALGE